MSRIYNNDGKFTPEQYDQMVAKLQIEKGLAIEEAITSKDPNAILKAHAYLEQQKTKVKTGATRGFMFDPYDASFSGGGYKRDLKKVSFEVLKRMGTLHICKMVKKTRIDQIKNFLNFTVDVQKEGFTIQRKIGLFDTREKESPKKDRAEIERIVRFIQNSKLQQDADKNSAINFDASKWDIYDDLDEFIAMILDDSLTYDQLAFELQRNRKFDLISYKAIDASTIRLLDTIDRRYWEDGEKKYDLVNGFLPRYAQVWGTEIQQNPLTKEQIVYYPWELGFATRNKTTDIYKNGYGESELETLVNIVTWILYGFEYNGNFFKNGSNPKGFINIKSGTGGQDSLNDFREIWRQMITGSVNSSRIPVFEGIDLEWVDLQQTNKEMEFQKWIEFLIIMLCAVYTIDPSELGFQFQQARQSFGQDGQKQRLEHSRNKGLKPLMMFLQKVISKYIVSEINPEFEFVFTGIDLEDDEKKIKNIDAALKAGITSFEKQFEAFEGEKYNPKKHTILNSVFQQAQQMKMYGGQGSNEAVDEEMGGEDEGAQNPFNEFDESNEEKDQNPIMRKSMEYIKQQFNLSMP
jgi:hypothetical protein